MSVIKEDNVQMEDDLLFSRSEEIEEVIGNAPHWLVQWGISLVFFFFLILLIITWAVKYPDVLRARVVITTNPPPLKFIARASGNVQLLVSDGEHVKPPRILAVIKNTATYTDVLYLEEKLQHVDYRTVTPVLLQDMIDVANKSLQLGDLQEPFEQFIQNNKELFAYYKINFHTRQIEQLGKQINEYNKLNNNLKGQQDLHFKEYQMVRKRFDVDSILLDQNVLAELDVDKSRVHLIQQNRIHKNAEAAVINNTIQVAALKNRILELELEKGKQQEQLISALVKSFKTLKSNIARWKETYLLEASAAGTISFFQFWTNDQFVRKDDQVLSIIPHADRIIGKIEVPALGSGKIREGQQVYIHLDNYPSDQYGMLEGKVTSISLMPNNNTYMLNVSLPKKLSTTFKKQIGFKHEMQGRTEIVTEDLRFIQRIFYKMRSIGQGSTN
jgi:hypothetical protein